MKLFNLQEIPLKAWQNFYAAIDIQVLNDPFMWNSIKIKDWLGHSLNSSVVGSSHSQGAASHSMTGSDPSGQKTLKSALSGTSEVWLTCLEGEIASFAIVQRVEPVVEILFLTTPTKFQRQGKMKDLLVELFDTVAEDGQLWLEVHERNSKAIGLYHRVGMKRVGKRPAYYRDGGGALLYGMSKSLPD